MTIQIAQPSSFAAQTAAFQLNAGSGSNLYVYDTDAGATITANDVRLTAQSSFTMATVSAAATVVGHTGAATGISEGYGVTDDIVLTLAEDASTDNAIGAATFTVSGAGAGDLVCTPYTGDDGTGAVVNGTTEFADVDSVVCAGAATDTQLKLLSFVVTNDSDPTQNTGTMTITITKGTDYAVGSTVAVLNSDLNLALTGGVAAAASFVWSDVSAQSHTSNTTDWTNGLQVKNLPTSTQVLSR